MRVFFTILVALLSPCQGCEDKRANELRMVLEGYTKLELWEVRAPSPFDAPEKALFTLTGAPEIRELLQSLSFEAESPGPCACMGDYKVAFFQNSKLLASVRYHHGESLSWNGKHWRGNSVFTARSLKAWRTWFKKQGEPRFQDAYEARIKAQKRYEANRNAFLNTLPDSIRQITGNHDTAAKKYYDSHPLMTRPLLEECPVFKATRERLLASQSNRKELASALAKSLGTLSLRGQEFGSWFGSGIEEAEIAYEMAKSLDFTDFEKALDSPDPATLLGVARLFFFAGLLNQAPAESRGDIAAKLIKTVAEHDRGGNASSIFHWLDLISSPKMTSILEQIALGDLKLPNTPYSSLSQSLSFPHYACLLLAETDSPKSEACLRRVSKLSPGYPDDKLALRIARAHQNPSVEIPNDVFDSESTPICLVALGFLEKRGSKTGLNLIISEATTHQWADIREQSVLTIERMTGKKWFKNGSNERAEWHGETIRSWWSENKATFVMPGPGGQ